MPSGYRNLGSFTLGAAGTQTGTVITGLAGMLGLSIQTKFDYGSGGTACKVYVQTSLDQGDTWIDIASIAFDTSDLTEVLNLTGAALTTPTAPSDGALTDNTCLNGPLGDRLRAKVISTGTYASTSVTVKVNVR